MSLNLEIVNIGLAPLNEVSLVIYDELNYTLEHELHRVDIQGILPNQTENISFTWKPKAGEYNLAFRLDPEYELDELRNDNNLRIEPVLVVRDDTDDDGLSGIQLYLVYGIIIIIIIFLLILYLKDTSPQQSNREKSKKQLEEKDRSKPKK